MNTEHTSSHIGNFYSQFYGFSHSYDTYASAVAVASGNAVDAIGGTIKCMPAFTIHNTHPHFTNPFRYIHLRCIDMNCIRRYVTSFMNEQCSH